MLLTIPRGPLQLFSGLLYCEDKKKVCGQYHPMRTKDTDIADWITNIYPNFHKVERGKVEREKLTDTRSKSLYHCFLNGERPKDFHRLKEETNFLVISHVYTYKQWRKSVLRIGGGDNSRIFAIFPKIQTLRGMALI